MNDKFLEDKVIKFVASNALCSPEQITVKTRIGEDLRIVGDDADELLCEFSEIFDVDMSELDFTRYFPDEASFNMHYYLTGLSKCNYKHKAILTIRRLESRFWRLFANKTNYDTMLVGDLVRAASEGKW